MSIIFKVFVEFVTVLLLFYVSVICMQSIWDLSFPTRDQTLTTFIGRQSLTSGLPGKSLCISNFLEEISATAKSLQSCPTLCNPMDCSPPGSSVHGIFQARVLESGAIAFSGDILLRYNSFSGCMWRNSRQSRKNV